MTSKTLNLVAVFLLLINSGCGGGGGTQASTTASVTLSADKTQVIASSRDKVTFTATVRDGSGSPLAGKTVDFNVPTGTYPYVSQGQTDLNGTAIIDLKYPPVGPNGSAIVAVTATSEGITSNEVTVTFSNPQQVPANVTLTADKIALLYSITERVVFTATATDAAGLPLVGQAFNASVQPGPFISAINPYTNNDGQATIMVQPNNDILPSGTWPIPTSLAVTASITGIQSNLVDIHVFLPF